MLLQVESDLTELIRANPLRSAKQIRELYVCGVVAPATLIKSYERFIKEKKESLDGTPLELSKNTKQRWYNCLSHLKEFLKDKEIELDSIDSDFGNRLYLYLIKKNKRRNITQKIGHDYAVRNITYLSNVLDFCKKKGLVQSNVLDIEYTRNAPKEVQYLTYEQLEILAKMKFTGILEDVRVCFLCMAYSGLNHCDLGNLSRLKGNDTFTLNIDREKNKKRIQDKAIIPILPELRKLLEQYNYQLPLHDLNTTNRHLHVFEGVLGVDIVITTYTARKTAAMIFSERGVSIDVISKILGHTSIVTTQRHYVKVVEKRVYEETKHLF